MNEARDGVRDDAPPRQVRAAQLLLFAMAFIGLIAVLGRSDGSSSYELGELTGPWLFVWVSALLALTYDGSARHRIRATTCGLLGFITLASVGQALSAGAPGEFLDCAVRIVPGGPVLTLLCLPEASAWFRRP